MAAALAAQGLAKRYGRVQALHGIDLEVAEGDGPRQTIVLTPGQSFHISTGLRHCLTALETCDVLEASTPELDDVVRLKDRYGRAGSTEP